MTLSITKYGDQFLIVTDDQPPRPLLFTVRINRDTGRVFLFVLGSCFRAAQTGGGFPDLAAALDYLERLSVSEPDRFALYVCPAGWKFKE